MPEKKRLDKTSTGVLIGEIDAVLTASKRCFDDLPPEAQARVTELQNSLGVLRLRVF